MIEFSKKINHVFSGIRGPLYQEALSMEKRGISVLKLNTGNPAVFGFTIPESLKTALLDNIDGCAAYSEPQGMLSARRAICDYHLKKGFKGVTEDDIYICNGVSEAAQMAVFAVLDRGDEALVPSPDYSLWSNNIYLAGATPVHYALDENNGWLPDIADIERKITKNTKVLLLINPNNPTGALYPEEVVEEIVRIARKYGLIVFSDEIYDRLVMDGKRHYSVAELAPDLPVLTFNGLSKSHIICGFRCGWITVSSSCEDMSAIKDALFRLAAMRLCGNTLTQTVIPAALKDEDSTREMLVPGGRLYEQRKVVMDVFSESDAVTCVPNSAAFYVFPKINKKYLRYKSDTEFGMNLLKRKKILIVPGSSFEYGGNDHFRIVMLPEPEKLKQAAIDIVDFIKNG